MFLSLKNVVQGNELKDVFVKPNHVVPEKKFRMSLLRLDNVAQGSKAKIFV